MPIWLKIAIASIKKKKDKYNIHPKKGLLHKKNRGEIVQRSFICFILSKDSRIIHPQPHIRFFKPRYHIYFSLWKRFPKRSTQ